MSDTNSWNWQGNSGNLAVKSKYASAPVEDVPPVIEDDEAPNANAETVDSATTDAPQEAPVDTNN